MRTHNNNSGAVLRRPASLVAAASLLCACAMGGATRPPATLVREANGFTITENVHASGAVRADFERATRLLEQEDYDRGIALLVEVTQAAPDLTTPHIDLAMAYRHVGDLEHAEASIQRALELNPRHPVANNELGIIYRKTGRFDEARKSYEKALAVYPDFHFARLNLAILCDLYLADAACALENYELYSKAVPSDESVGIWVADLRSRIGK